MTPEQFSFKIREVLGPFCNCSQTIAHPPCPVHADLDELFPWVQRHIVAGRLAEKKIREKVSVFKLIMFGYLMVASIFVLAGLVWGLVWFKRALEELF